MPHSSLGAFLNYMDFLLPETVKLLHALMTLFVDLTPETG